MKLHSPHPRQIQAQLQALGDEIQSIREEHDGHITGLGERLREAEERQQQLRHQLNTAMDRSVGPLGNTCSGHAMSHNITALQEFSGGTKGFGKHGSRYSSLPATTSARYRGSPPRLPPSQLADLDATPHPHGAVLHSCPDGLQPPRKQQAQAGSKDNAAYLPMVMENIMAERHRHERRGTLRSCGFTLEQGKSNGARCSQNSFHMPCFRAHHFCYCRQHMRVIPGAKMVCSHRSKQDCLVVVFEDHEGWDTIVDAALAAGNLGNKGVDAEELKEALFPPQDYPHRYMRAQD
ncbi:hypothetical protein G6011_01774 [Alternaria panax]|uniref:Uncharacterized protein n=1 Tax=Alternaria panax TaxID=48097 RepID=A0AAD4IKV8_9PLEO|nr:hypothetical protein G6011_01774 [Alternaria panax]